jgi:hypothetical protein
MEGAPFLEWLKSQITDQMKAGGKVDAKRVESAAELNRNNFIETGALAAMKYLADQPEVTARLLHIASLKEARLTDRRTRALQALEGKVGSAQLEELLGLALDPANPTSVRDYAFDRVGDVHDPKAIPAMWPLVQNAEDQRLRWRAGELVLAIGGSAMLPEFFAKLPSSGSVAYEPEELDGYAQRMTQMSPLPRDLAVAQLHSPNWWNNVIGLDYLQRKGSEADVAEMSALAHSSAATKGKHWDDNQKTVGKVAEQAIAALRERVKEESGGAPGSAPK